MSNCEELREVPAWNKMAIEGLGMNEKGIPRWQGVEGRVRKGSRLGTHRSPYSEGKRGVFRRYREPEEAERGHRRGLHQKAAGNIVKCPREVTWKNKAETSGCGSKGCDHGVILGKW